MTWKKSDKPKNNLITLRCSDEELAQVKALMKREKISKQEAARRLAFLPGEN